jgi:Carboxypeptidase regulatory-like domain
MMKIGSILLTVNFLVMFVAGCAGTTAGASPTASAAHTTGIGGTATAGPVCPVEKIPPDPSCAPRPVAGANLVVRDPAGSEIARATTAADGTFFVDLPPGRYTVEPQAVTGLMGTARLQNVTVTGGVVSTIQVEYDTGIR